MIQRQCVHAQTIAHSQLSVHVNCTFSLTCLACLIYHDTSECVAVIQVSVLQWLTCLACLIYHDTSSTHAHMTHAHMTHAHMTHAHMHLSLTCLDCLMYHRHTHTHTHLSPTCRACVCQVSASLRLSLHCVLSDGQFVHVVYVCTPHGVQLWIHKLSACLHP